MGDNQGSYTCYQVCFTGEYYNSIPLEYAFEIYDSSGDTRLYSSLYYDSGTPVNVGLPLVQSTDGIVYRCHLYVRKKDDNSQIERTEMYASAWTWYLNRTTEVSENNTLPADWVENTTNAGAEQFVPFETVTTPISPEDTSGTIDEFKQFLEGVQEYETLATVFMGYVSELLRLKGVTAFLCFALCCITMITIFELSGGD